MSKRNVKLIESFVNLKSKLKKNRRANKGRLQIRIEGKSPSGWLQSYGEASLRAKPNEGGLVIVGINVELN